jgi:hypothetical protein
MEPMENQDPDLDTAAHITDAADGADAADAVDSVAGTDRRTFLQRSGSVLLAGLGARMFGVPADAATTSPAGAGRSGLPARAAPPSPSLVVPLRGRRPALTDQMHRDTFARHVQTPFRFQTAAGPVSLVLKSVRDGASASGGECFAVVFTGPRDIPLLQATYRVEHARMGAFDLFIVPVGPDERGLLYEAVFNRVAA